MPYCVAEDALAQGLQARMPGHKILRVWATEHYVKVLYKKPDGSVQRLIFGNQYA